MIIIIKEIIKQRINTDQTIALNGSIKKSMIINIKAKAKTIKSGGRRTVKPK